MACKWLNINRGHSTQYSKLIREFFEEDKRSPEHILAYSESCEIMDIYDLWEGFYLFKARLHFYVVGDS
jgi:hypothetical protein